MMVRLALEAPERIGDGAGGYRLDWRRLFRIEAVAERDAAGRWLDCFATEETGA